MKSTAGQLVKFSTLDYSRLKKFVTNIYIGFEALHGEVSIYVWFAVTPCVYRTLENCLSIYSTTEE